MPALENRRAESYEPHKHASTLGCYLIMIQEQSSSAGIEADCRTRRSAPDRAEDHVDHGCPEPRGPEDAGMSFMMDLPVLDQ